MRCSAIRKFGAAFGLPALFAFVPARAAGQSTQKPRYLILTIYQVKASADADFADLLKNKWIARDEEGRCFAANSLAPFDGNSTLSKGAERPSRAHQRALQIEDGVVTILRRRAEISSCRETPQDSPLLPVQPVKIAPGTNQKNIALWKSDVSPAGKQIGHAVSTWSGIPGDGNHFMLPTALSSYSNLYKGVGAARLSRRPAEYEAFNMKIGPMFTNMRREVLRPRTDLMDMRQPLNGMVWALAVWGT